MAKKGGVQQLQQDVTNDDEFDKLLDRPGLLVLDIYSEWCGPCLGMVGSLKKIKLELGGDNLQLAICKADGITALARFRNKSEPTWMFVTKRKAVDLMFGTNVPKLMAMITKELTLLNVKDRITYEITDPHPEEIARMNVVQAAEAEAKRIEQEEAIAKRKAYLISVTDEILMNLPDMGVTIFGPQVNRDMFKRLMEPAEHQRIQCKDRKVVPISPEEFHVINFDCSNPLDSEIILQLEKKELLVCFWKIHEEDKRPLEEIFIAYAHDIVSPTPYIDELGMVDPEKEIPALLHPLEVKFKPVVEKPAEKEEPEKPDEPPPAPDDVELPLDDVMAEGALEEEEAEEEGEEEEKVEDEIEVKVQESDEDLGFTKIIMIPPVWVPHDRRTHASLIYVLFRNQTSAFLPPDPPPEPPHLVMAFDAYKTKDIAEIIKKNGEDILHYGYFTSDNHKEAQFITNSIPKYQRKSVKDAADKLVLKVSKKTSHTMLTLVTYGPSYVSPNTVLGKQEALKFFPDGYKSLDPTEAEKEDEGETTRKSKKKSKKSTHEAKPEVEEQPVESVEVKTPEVEDAPPPAEEQPKGETTQPKEESPAPPNTVEGESPPVPEAAPEASPEA